MKSMCYIGIGVVLALDWAALDDITTGNEPDFAGEFVALAISIPILVLLARCIVKLGQQRG